MSNVHTKGLSELEAFLSSFTENLSANVVPPSLLAGVNVLAEEARSNVHVDDGALRSSVRTFVTVKRGKVIASVKAGGKQAPHAHFAEFGTAAHLIKAKNGQALSFDGHAYSSVDHPGAKASPFMRPALDHKAAEALEAVAEYTKQQLARNGVERGGK